MEREILVGTVVDRQTHRAFETACKTLGTSTTAVLEQAVLRVIELAQIRGGKDEEAKLP